jgi:hypothetical protein
MRRLLVAALLILALLPAPRPVAALSCVTLDFASGLNGFVVNQGAYSAGTGFTSTGDYAAAAYNGIYTVTQIVAYYDVTTPGTSTANQSSITVGGSPLVSGAAQTAAGNYTMTWSNAGDPQSNAAMVITIAAPTGGAVALTSAYICGATLPVEWTGGDPFPEETPWLRPTPTPWAIDDGEDWASPISFDNDDVGEFADTIINSYNFLNQDNVLDFAIAAIMALMLIGLVTKAIRSGKEL